METIRYTRPFYIIYCITLKQRILRLGWLGSGAPAWVHWATHTHPVTRTNGNNVDPLFVKTYPTIRTLVNILGLYSVTPSTKETNTYRQSEANF